MSRVMLAVLAVTGGAHAAPTARECVAANERSIKLRDEHALRASRAELAICTSSACPAEIVNECERRLRMVVAETPTIVIAAKDEAGNDRDDVRVLLDGDVIAERLDGSAIQLDPGRHTLTLEPRGAPPTTRTIIIAEGEHRHEPIVMARAAMTVRPVRDARRRAAGLVVGSVGLGGVVVGIVTGAVAANAWSQAQQACATPTSCVDHQRALDDHDLAMTMAIASTIGFIGGVALVALGGVLFFTAPIATPSSASLSFGMRF